MEPTRQKEGSEPTPMPCVQSVRPQYRDADPDGLIGLRGVMRNFQDIHTWAMHAIDRGNDVIPERYGAGWVYTRYHLVLREKPDYTDDMTLTAWMEPYRQPVLVNMDMTVTQHGRLMAMGKLECCVFSLTRGRPLRLSAIDFPENVPEEIPNEIPDFIGLEKTAEGMAKRYRRVVRVSDLDKNRHMNNLRYIEMFQDAHDSAFWDALAPVETEISFISQCLEGETLSVRSRVDGNRVYLAALHEDGRLAAVALFHGADQAGAEEEKGKDTV